jgi:hypothetical protein
MIEGTDGLAIATLSTLGLGAFLATVVVVALP